MTYDEVFTHDGIRKVPSEQQQASLLLCDAMLLQGDHVVSNALQATFNATLDGPMPNATGPNSTWTSYTLTFDGTCGSDYLTNYGQNGPVGYGLSLLDNTGIRSNYVNVSAAAMVNTTAAMAPASAIASGTTG